MIGAAHAASREIGICGQVPSDYAEFAQFLVTEGIDSWSRGLPMARLRPLG